MQKVSLPVLLAMVLALVLVACAPAGPAGPAGPSTDLKVEMDEFKFMPESLSVPAGQNITLELKNSGSIAHDFTILKKGVAIQGAFDPDQHADQIVFRATLDAGKSQSFGFLSPAEPGEYQIICAVPGHYQSGMRATLTVVVP